MWFCVSRAPSIVTYFENFLFPPKYIGPDGAQFFIVTRPSPGRNTLEFRRVVLQFSATSLGDDLCVVAD